MLPVNLETFDSIVMGNGNDSSLKLQASYGKEMVVPHTAIQGNTLLLGALLNLGGCEIGVLTFSR
jgi:hypothetical protein